MTIGLLTEPKSYKRRFLLNRFLHIRLYDKIILQNNSLEIDAEILPYSAFGLETLSAYRLEKLILNKVNFFRKQGITQLLLSDFLFCLCKKQGIDISAFSNNNGKSLFLKLMPLCLRQITRTLGIDLFLSNVCIRDSKMDRISEYLIRELCFDTKNINLCTQNSRRANAFCEGFCDETGLWVDISSSPDGHFDILLDVDRCQIKIGNDLYIRDVKFPLDFCGYNISYADVASLLPAIDPMGADWVYSYEK